MSHMVRGGTMLRLMLLMLSVFRIATIGRLLESNDPPGSGNQRTKPSDLLTQYNGDAARMAERLADVLNDNFKGREKNRTLEAENERLKANQKPEGAVVLTGDDVKAYEAYTALGKPDEIKAKLGERDTFEGELTGLKRDATLRDVAQEAGFAFPVLKRLGADREYEIRDEQRDGKPVKRPYIKDGDTFKPLDEYAAQDAEWAPFLPSLRPTEAATGTTARSYPTQAPAGSGTAPSNAGVGYIQQKYAPRRQAGA